MHVRDEGVELLRGEAFGEPGEDREERGFGDRGGDDRQHERDREHGAVFCSNVRAPAATPRRLAGTVPIIAAVLGLLNMPEPAPTISSQRALCQLGVWTCSVVIAARPAALTSIPSAARPREPWRSA